MRIVVVGSGRSVHVVARSAALARRGHAVRLVTAGAVVEAEGLEVRTRPRPHGLLGSVRATRGFVHDVRSFRPDLLHLHYAGGKLGTLALLTGVRPLVVTVMGGDVLPDQHPGGLPAAERRATRRILRAADLLLVKSDALRAALAPFRPLRARVETVRWGVDPALFHRSVEQAAAARAELGLEAVDRVILSPRVLAPLYNTHLLVQALPRVLRHVPQARLLLTEYNADPDYRATLEALANDLGVAHRIRFVGRWPHARMPALYSLADVVVTVPGSDGLPQSLLEALACRVPVVLSRLPGYAEVVTEHEDALFADLDPEDVARAVTRVLTDEALAARLAARGCRRVAEVALLPREAERVEALCADLLQGPRAHASALGRLREAISLILR